MLRIAAILWLWTVGTTLGFAADPPKTLRAGAAKGDITPPIGLPMWGYAARHDAPAVGVLDPLQARAVVIEVGGEKLAIVATDLGRGPTPAMLAEIQRELLAKAQIRRVLVCGSHTHHGPVLELTDSPGRGKGKYDSTIAYSRKLPGLIVETVLKADRDLRPAKIGTSSQSVAFNRNRQAKKRRKVTDPNLVVLRLDDVAGKPIALLVNYAAHPTMTDAKVLKYSADYVGYLRTKVESELDAPCLFLQGASGDLSTSTPPGVTPGPKGFGESLGASVVALAKGIDTAVPTSPSLSSDETVTRFSTRIDLKNPLVQTMYGRAFFPDLIACAGDEHGGGVDARLSTVVLNGDVALVGVSGEFFCEHANRLRSRLDVKTTLFLGYCNGHHFYFPTIEAAAEGGYGAEPGVSLAELGAGERLMDQALLSIERMLDRFPAERR